MAEHAKHPDWITPMKMKGAGKGSYDASIESGSGSRGAKGTSASPAGKDFTVSPGVEKLMRNQRSQKS